MAAATQERSNCLGCQGGLVYFLVLDLLGLPGLLMLPHGIEHRQPLMHTRRQSDFLDVPRREQPLLKGFDPCVEARGHAWPHVEHGTHVRAASPDGTPTAQGSAGAIAWGHTD